MAMLLGKKIGMTRVYDGQGRLVPVTVIQAGPCKVMQVKTVETDGYRALQLGFDDVKEAKALKPAAGHAAKSGTTAKRFVREWRLAEGEGADYKAGDAVLVGIFEKTTFVNVAGTSKGKGYQGVMRRHGFGGFPASHGTERKHRAPGSLSGHGTDRGHGGDIKKGKRMSGHMGAERVTSKNHRIVSIDAENNLLVVKGPVPGPAGTYLEICCSKTHRK